MSRPEAGLARARLFRYQLLPVSQEFGNELEQEPLGRQDGPVIRPPEDPRGVLGHWHRGTDIACPVGVPIRLVLGGTVRVLPFDVNGFGNGVQCDGSRYRTTYGHLSVIRVVSGEDRFHGDLIALSGSTGNSTGPHLHFEVFDKHQNCWIDPWSVV